MKKIGILMCLWLSCFLSYGQVVINELDSDTEGIDYEEFIELKTIEPFYSLDNYVLVFFNGSESGGNKSYLTIDLTGYTSDINGILLIGSTHVSPVPQLLIEPNIIQNGADAVGLYYGAAEDYPDWTLATTDNLIDALVYGNSDPVSTDLLELLGQTEQIDENINNNKDFESIQRNADGSYFVGSPTPGKNNDGNGVELNGVTVTIPEEVYEEGDSFEMSFTTEMPVDEDLEFDFSLSNDNFNTADFEGETTVVIPEGEAQAVIEIHLLEDGEEEGDEVLLFQFGDLPDEYIRMNDFIEVRIVDMDFSVADFGSPLAPTYGVVESTQPTGYYDSLDGLAGDELRQALQDIVANPEVVRAQTYADIIDILKEADQNPENSNQVWLLYLEKGRAKMDYQTTSNSVGKWNREHTFPRSRAGFEARDGDDIATGKDVYWTTNADSLRHGFSDAHALRAADGPENSVRNNQHYGPEGYDGPEDTAGSFYGDVARGIFYMDIRYNGLEIVDGYPEESHNGKLGDKQAMLFWNQVDPPDDFEMNRNNIIYTWQYNRNPFIDYPELIDYLWGDKVGEVWHQPDMRIKPDVMTQIRIYPNPSSGTLYIHGLHASAKLSVFAMDGRRLISLNINGDQRVDMDLTTGVYILKIQSNQMSYTDKLIIK